MSAVALIARGNTQDNRSRGGIALVILAVALTAVAQTTRSVWDGVYSQEQADRGKTAYAEQCALCHGAELAGGDETPALTGDKFMANWHNHSVGELFERVRVSMPADRPGTLTRQRNSDILAYILAANNSPENLFPDNSIQ